MEKSFEPSAIESKWYAAWEAAGDFSPRGDGTPYCILLPPPNVTGTLHMGHAFQQTIMDALTRYHRMRGFRTLWQGGTDHAGIATQKIVENRLAADGKSRHDLGRAKFVERVWEWKGQSGSTITHQMRRLGASVDWSRERFTMDEGLSAAVRRVFVQWYRDGLLYRGRRLVNWDPVLMTAVSDLEVDSQEKEGSLWSIRYPASDGGEGLVVATTRPETMLGDVAVAVHPDDERYRHLIGKTLKLPLTDREIPVIADDYVDREFGTGCVKITPAHDFNDYQLWVRHKAELKKAPFQGLISIFTFDGKLKWSYFHDSAMPDSVILPDGSQDIGNGVLLSENLTVKGERAFAGPSVKDSIPKKYRGLDRFAARKQIIADLEESGLLIETKKHKLQIPVSQRTDAVIEPMLTDQWFLDLTSETRIDGKPGPGGRRAITEPALAAVRDGEIKFVPENWATTYNQWLENIQDWCVSRQLWWGHQIPAWYDKDGNTYVGESEEDLLAHYPKLQRSADGTIYPELHQDKDVLDTWFSSALWPFSTMGWPSESPVKNERGVIVANWPQDQQFLPSAVLVTGFDIIFFWVARMVMATQYFTGRVPFREVYINAIVRDAEGAKMSKSKGNTIDPLDLIDGIGLDALVKKSTSSLLIPQVREKVEKRIRRDYPDGIAAVGTDALRFTFAALATYGRTINFDLKRAGGYKAFCNKLWNAARFVLMNVGTGGREPETGEAFASLPARAEEAAPAGAEGRALALKTEAERWIVARLHATLADVEAQMKLYRFDLVAQALYEFVWNEYCDWFVELAKPALSRAEGPALSGNDKAVADSTRHTLLFVLEAALRALHPITPFITEEIFQSVAPLLGLKETSIAQRGYPRAGDFPADDTTASADIEWLRAALIQIRRIRSEMNIAPGKTIPLLYANGSATDHARADRFAAQIAFLARAESQRWLATGEVEPAAAAAIVGEMKWLIPLAGLIDLDAEKARLEKEIKRLDGETAKSNAKLAHFGPKTPPAVVEQEKQRIAEFTTTLGGLKEQLGKLGEV